MFYLWNKFLPDCQFPIFFLISQGDEKCISISKLSVIELPISFNLNHKNRRSNYLPTQVWGGLHGNVVVSAVSARPILSSTSHWQQESSSARQSRTWFVLSEWDWSSLALSLKWSLAHNTIHSYSAENIARSLSLSSKLLLCFFLINVKQFNSISPSFFLSLLMTHSKIKPHSQNSQNVIISICL